ncbi:hypothetical protein HPB52_000213 [Rhipicephalus sanguineus]|uniref:Tc1-like transposase DDE domain-containing protein n=1 Tax=Rhipicephalus sanguineus TaxID=34632 RepID=A0A9D4QEV9_RHISA|nr:hypothetical protein HPB52_000213 [Rhipicephalus sanguineus]
METSVVTSERDPLLPNEPCVASMATPPRSLGKKKSGHILNSDSRNMLFHCYTYWRNREPERSVEDTSKFVADMLGVGERTVFRVREEVKASHFSGGKLTTPSRKRPRNAEKSRRSAKFDSFTLCALGKNITYGKRMIKKQLLDLIASVKSRFLSYIVDNTAVKAGCIVLWLPPYHCEFNAIEPVWAKVKNGVAPYNRDLQLSTVDAILSDKIKQTKRSAASPMFAAISLRRLTAQNKHTRHKLCIISSQ